MLHQNDYSPPDWLPVLEAVISRINIEDEETRILLQLLNSVVETGEENVANHIPFMVSSLAGVLYKHVHPNMEMWPQVCINVWDRPRVIFLLLKSALLASYLAM